ncbi:dihydrofolate reductase family protein [Mucilaginibacter sp. OK098]|uniref:dihydrofolate reductase family protein n=1 Tax=Mucilaginibacter sp. OK098 TaxID=1855297 RepID=UPI00091985D6|nr:dihydrofolate reductase family protein [Mucilaginibacter sp. OK098]SHM83110.1 Dihydrofolate reductase [Mucilaginibacter sp. OK098]
MGKVISLINTTPDGFVDSQYVIADAEFHEFVHGLLANAYSVAFGKNTFELFQQIWPAILEKEGSAASQVKMAKALGGIPKIAYSSKLESTTWSNSSIAEAINPDQISRKKQDNTKDLLSIGSPGLVAAMTTLNLVDEYYFCIQPVIAGSGSVRLFDKIGLDARQPLRFVAATQLKSGVVILHYQKVG